MTELVRMDDARFEEMYEVMQRFVKNEHPTTIAKELGLTRRQVLDHIEFWKNSAAGSEIMKDRAKELVVTMDEHYSSLIRKLYEIIDEVDGAMSQTPQFLAQKANAIKQIADLESKRIDVMQRAGMLDDAETGAHYAAIEEKQRLLVDILRHDLCPACKKATAAKLSNVTGRVETVVVYQNE